MCCPPPHLPALSSSSNLAQVMTRWVKQEIAACGDQLILFLTRLGRVLTWWWEALAVEGACCAPSLKQVWL